MIKKVKYSMIIGGASLIIGASTNVLAAPSSIRISGSDRYETAIQVSKAGWAEKSKCAVLATGNDFPDALCAAPLARKLNAPILLNNKDSLLDNVKDELKRLGVEQVYIIGGQGAISNKVEDQVKEMNITCTRICGNDRYETSIKVAEQLNMNGDIAVATGDDFPDAISISSIAAQKGMPILLTEKDRIPSNLSEYLKNKNISNTYIIGGSDVVSDNVASNFQNVNRLFGNDRYDTSREVLNKFSDGLNFNSIYVATGNDYPDALAVSALAVKNSSPVCLVDGSSVDKLKTMLISKLQDNTTIEAIGGSDVLPEYIVEELKQTSGNTNGNLQHEQYFNLASTNTNGGFVASQGDWDYYYNTPYPFGKGYICKVKKDGTDSVVINSFDNNDTVSNINVMGEWIYYEKTLNTVEDENYIRVTEGIYKLKTDGSSNTKICSDDARNIIVVGDWIYYINNSDNRKLYKVKVDGTQKTKITDEFCLSINVSGDWIYYSSSIKYHSEKKMYKIKFDGTGKVQIPCDDRFINMVVDGEYIYYLNPTDNGGRAIYRMRLDGTENTKLKDVYKYASLLNVSLGDVYYIDEVIQSPEKSLLYLYKISKDGGVHNIPCPTNIQNFWVTGNNIYFNTFDFDTKKAVLYRMDTSGNNLKTINSLDFKLGFQ